MMTNGIAAIAAERQRQIDVEGWTPEHDDEHAPQRGRGDVGQMAEAAICYIVGSTGVHDLNWPWAMRWWKPRSYRENLVRAGALIAAEIDRVDRAEAAKAQDA
jgi:hypothetical protein